MMTQWQADKKQKEIAKAKKQAAAQKKDDYHASTFAVIAALGKAMTLVAQYGNGPVKSAHEVVEWRDLLDTILMPGAAAVLAAWIGGAPPAASQTMSDVRQSAEKTAFKQTKGAKQYTVKAALIALGKLSPELRSIVANKGMKKEIKAAKNQQKNVDEAVDKLYSDAFEAVKPGLTIGAGVVALVVVAVVFLKLS